MLGRGDLGCPLRNTVLGLVVLPDPAQPFRVVILSESLRLFYVPFPVHEDSLLAAISTQSSAGADSLR